MAGGRSGIASGDSLKVLIDMNLSPVWANILQEVGFDAIHWSAIGDPSAPDSDLFEAAALNGQIIFTNDLDFGVMLHQSKAEKPSVIQLRTRDVTPNAQGEVIIALLRKFGAELEAGAFVSVELDRSRVRILPLGD